MRVCIPLSMLESEITQMLPMQRTALGVGLTVSAVKLYQADDGKLGVESDVSADLLAFSARGSVRASGRPMIRDGALFLDDPAIADLKITGDASDGLEKRVVGSVLSTFAKKARDLRTRFGVSDADSDDMMNRLERATLEASQKAVSAAAKAILSRMPIYKRTLLSGFVNRITVEDGNLVIHLSWLIVVFPIAVAIGPILVIVSKRMGVPL